MIFKHSSTAVVNIKFQKYGCRRGYYFNENKLKPGPLFFSRSNHPQYWRELYQSVVSLPLISPHGHVDIRLFSAPDKTFGSPADLLIIPDHYVTRMLYSQGIPLETLGIPDIEGEAVQPITERFGGYSVKISISSAALPAGYG